MTALGILWFALIAVLIAGYFILDGFDLGAGILSPFIAKNENEKAVVRRTIGHRWRRAVRCICSGIRYNVFRLLSGYHARAIRVDRPSCIARISRP